MPQMATHLIWIDLEMTGLNPAQDTIIEIATVVTDSHLHVVAEGPVLAVHQPPEIMAAMDDWNTRQHGNSGLTRRVLDSRTSMQDAEAMTLNFLEQHVPPNTSPMCGNSICQDRQFLRLYMPNLEKYFHYRQIDVSTLKELKRRWRPTLAEFQKESRHLALSDIHDSIEELRYYRTCFLQLHQFAPADINH